VNGAIYARKSNEQKGVTDEQKSVARQEDNARAYAHAHGWPIHEPSVFVDDGISGAQFAGRPGFVRLMNSLKPKPPFNVLIMSEISRLGREQIETAYALKQLSVAGVRCFSYLEDREILMESATDKFLLSAVNYAAEIEREKASQRVHDALLRKARAGHVATGAKFGYENIPTVDASGRHSHVERRINKDAATVIVRIFSLSRDGHGYKAIAKILNAEGALSPQSQGGRPRNWAASSVCEVLQSECYRGLMTWNKTRDRDKWGLNHVTARPQADWVSHRNPKLQIVSDELWNAVHARLATVREVYAGGDRANRPALAGPAKYLLSNLALCGSCGSGMWALSSGSGTGRIYRSYACASYHAGRGQCRNNTRIPLDLADGELIDALMKDVLDEQLVLCSVNAALATLRGDGVSGQLKAVEAELRKVEQEHARYVRAIGIAGERKVRGLLDALESSGQRVAELQAERDHVRTVRPFRAGDIARTRRELLDLAHHWRELLTEEDPQHTRPIIASLLEGRVTITPKRKYEWELSGRGTLFGLFAFSIHQQGARHPLASHPTGVNFRRIIRAA